MATTKSRKSATRKPTAKRAGGSAARSAPKPKMPDVIYAQASPRSIGGVSLFEAQGQISAETVVNFMSEDARNEAAVEMLQRAGFEVLQVSEFTINIAGSRQTYENAFNTKLTVESRSTMKERGKQEMAEFIDSPETALPGLIATDGTPFESVLEGVAIEEPRYFMAPNFNPPLRAYWHLHPPGDLSAALNADRAHRAGLTGRGVKVAMVDSGWFRHPYFTVRGYNAANAILGPAAANPLADESGHGTGESANIFAVAPDVQLLPVKMNFVNTTGAFNAAVGLGPDIITCSWGSSNQNGPLSAADMALAAAIASAVASGIVVVFAAGNGQWGFPGQHPDVISAGGVFMRPDETLTASNYASGFPSNIYPGRSVPDLCGLVGQKPGAVYIMLPLEPGDAIDVGNAGGTHATGKDETPNNDGWAAFSGTSAAAPQLAGAAALIKQACSRLTPREVRDILMRSARDVTTGTSQQGFTAGPGFDQATGAGLLDAHRAAMLARLRCIPITGPTPIAIQPPVTPIQPPINIQPPIQPPITVQPPIHPPIQPPILIQPQPQPIDAASEAFGLTRPLPRPISILPPVRPIKPAPIKPSPIKPSPIKPGPIEPAPIKPPIQPIRPIRPIRPILPITPVQPIEPIFPVGPIRPVEPQPIKPIRPIVGPDPIGPVPFEGQGGQGGGGQEGGGLSAEDAKALEDMIVSGDVDIE